MHKAQIVSPILDMQIKQRSYKKHMDTLVTMKPAIDTSKPPPVPRLDVYKKRVTRERIMQLQIENENIKVLKNIGKQRNKSSKAYKTAESLSDEDFIEDWEDKLNLVDVELNSKSSNGRPTPLLSDLSKIHSIKNVINDDGMEVVDEGVTPKPVVVKPFDSSTKKRPNTSRSGLRRLNPLKKPSNRRRHQQQEEEDYNDNDIDDDEENDSNADFVYNKSDNDDYNKKYSSDSSCSFSEEENINTNEKINYPRKKIDDEDEDSFDRYDKASETTDRNADRSIQLFSGNLDDFESSSKSNKSESSDIPRKGNGGLSDSDQESNILSRKRKNEDSNTEEMRQSRRKKGKRNNSSDSNDTERTISNEIKKTSKESYSKNDDGFDNFEDFENDDESEEKAQKDKSDVDNSINNGNDDDDDLNMDSIPEF